MSKCYGAQDEVGRPICDGKNVRKIRARVNAVYVAMMKDGTPDTDEDGAPNVGEVSNMFEEGDEELLKEINVEFGTALEQRHFAGR